jgi:hypothetical protein
MLCRKCGSPTRVVSLEYRGEDKHRWRRCKRCDTLQRTIERHVSKPGPPKGSPITWTPVSGEAHPASVLSDEDVRHLRRLAAEGLTHRALATKFGISATYVSRLVRGLARPNT